MLPPLGRDIKQWCASDVSVAYIGPKLRTERPRKTKIATGVAHITRDSVTTFKIKRSKVNLQGRGHIVVASRTAYAKGSINIHVINIKVTWRALLKHYIKSSDIVYKGKCEIRPTDYKALQEYGNHTVAKQMCSMLLVVSLFWKSVVIALSTYYKVKCI